MGRIRHVQMYSDKVLQKQTFVLLSDLHLAEGKGKEHIIQLVREHHIPYHEVTKILLLGDIVNDASALEKKSFQKEVIEAMELLTQKVPTVWIPGNHDQMQRKNHKWWLSSLIPLKITLSKIHHFTMLDNRQTILTEGNVKIGTFPLPYSYYEEQGEDMLAFHHLFYQEAQRDIFTKDTFNMMLMHTPNGYMQCSHVVGESIVPHTDVALFGHMHNGICLDFLAPYFKNRGFISPQRTLFPNYAQGITSIGDTTCIINGPINSMVTCPIVNQLLGPHMTVLTIEKTHEKRKTKVWVENRKGR